MSVLTPTRPPSPRPAVGSTSRPSRTVADRAARVRFRRAVGLMAMTLIVPGSAQLSAGNRRVGQVALWTWITLVAGSAACLLVAVLHPPFAFWLVSDLGALQAVRLLLMALAVAWAGLLVDAWRIGRFRGRDCFCSFTDHED